MFILDCGIQLRTFRHPPATDLEDNLKLRNDHRVAAYLTMRPVVPRGEKFKEEFKEMIENEAEMFCIVETIPTTISAPGQPQSEPQFVGITGLWRHLEPGHRHSTFSVALLPEFWNKGYGKAITRFMINHAFVQLNMHRVSLEVYEGNEFAAAIYRKLGFVEEGRKRKARWHNGRWTDVIFMGILADEWAEINLRIEG